MRYFLDTEFNGMGGALISLALVSVDGHRELYLSLPCHNPVPWVEANVIPVVTCPGAYPKVRWDTAIPLNIFDFLREDSSPQIVADWPDDIAYFCKALITGPGQMVDIQRISFEIVRVDAYPTDLPGAIQHNALWDARALRRKIVLDYG